MPVVIPWLRIAVNTRKIWYRDVILPYFFLFTFHTSNFFATPNHILSIALTIFMFIVQGKKRFAKQPWLNKLNKSNFDFSLFSFCIERKKSSTFGWRNSNIHWIRRDLTNNSKGWVDSTEISLISLFIWNRTGLGLQ